MPIVRHKVTCTVASGAATGTFKNPAGLVRQVRVEESITGNYTLTITGDVSGADLLNGAGAAAQSASHTYVQSDMGGTVCANEDYTVNITCASGVDDETLDVYLWVVN